MTHQGTVWGTMSSPVGELWLQADSQGLMRITFKQPDYVHESTVVSAKHHRFLYESYRWLKAYFDCDPLPPLPRFHLKGSPFQLTVWQMLLHIPYGQTKTYGELARLLGNPHAAQAIGQAIRRNPCPFIIPCHRVKSAHGPGGYAWGLPLKQWLWLHETSHPAQTDLPSIAF